MNRLTLKSGEEIELNQAFNCDCLEFMNQLPDKCIDLVLTDPPYGIGEDGKKNQSRGSAANSSKWKGSKNTTGAGVPSTIFKDKKWDNEIPKKEIFKEMFRISKNQIIWGGNYFIEHLNNTSSFIVWDKVNGTTDFADCELAWTSHKKAVRQFKYQWNGMLQGNMKNKEKRIHPTQKPKNLFVWCLKNYLKDGNIIFDPFLGSFTTAVACNEMGLNWIGCEKDPDYFKSGYDRYTKETKQLLMDF